MSCFHVLVVTLGVWVIITAGLMGRRGSPWTTRPYYRLQLSAWIHAAAVEQGRRSSVSSFVPLTQTDASDTMTELLISSALFFFFFFLDVLEVCSEIIELVICHHPEQRNNKAIC